MLKSKLLYIGENFSLLFISPRRPKLKINIKQKNSSADGNSASTFDISEILDKLHGK